MGLIDAYASTFRDRRDVRALEWDDGTIVSSTTFGEIDVARRRLALGLAARGLRAGDRLALFLPNDPFFVDLFLACVSLGVIVVPVNVLYRQRELSHILSDAAPVAVVAAPELAEHLPPGTSVWLPSELRADAARQTTTAELPGVSEDTIAALVYTSGTTGKAKGASLTHANFLANARALLNAWEISASDRYLAVLPLFHVHGLGNGIQSWLLSGCTMRLVEKFSLDRAADWFADFRPTLFFGVPTVYVRLLELPDTDLAKIGRGMRLFVSGSAPLPSSVLESFEARSGHRILERYGMSETLMTISNPYHGERRAGTVGLPLPGVDVRLLDPNGHDTKDDEMGEVHVRGPQIFAGYWGQREATANAFRDGFFKTGDLATRSGDGYYTLRGRASELIISGGFNIYPREIEELLLEQPGVREVAVVGRSDERRGEVPVAYIVGEVDANALEAACRASLASFKVPRRFVAVPALPRTALGKLQKHLLPA